MAFLGFDLTASSLRERRAGYREAADRLKTRIELPVEIVREKKSASGGSI